MMPKIHLSSRRCQHWRCYKNKQMSFSFFILTLHLRVVQHSLTIMSEIENTQQQELEVLSLDPRAGAVSQAPPSSQVAILPNATNVEFRGSPALNAAGRDLNQTFNQYLGRDTLDVLRELLNPIPNPVKKQVGCTNRTGPCIKMLEELSQWTLEQDTTRIAWVHGAPNSGKSELAVSLAEKLRQMDEQVVLALTFHCVKGLDTWLPSALVPTICYSLAKKYPDYAAVLLDMFKRDVSLHVMSLPLREQLAILFKPLHAMDPSLQKPTVIIIDGLDEWGSALDRCNLLDTLQDHLGRITWIRVVITSRPEVDIDRAMLNRSLVKSFRLNRYFNPVELLESHVGIFQFSLFVLGILLAMLTSSKLWVFYYYFLVVFAFGVARLLNRSMHARRLIQRWQGIELTSDHNEVEPV
ncbi:hypothetical protein D9757_008849 [Collybiopsis confluens]|uniref:Nephrocystin 3-like N-terminal domain-containing protein n=1 Tax=Collybiopsis confluens TaxID=2823264 RepID=A0A8H5M0B5_9AGAR|nr:hypothetical protein D9757_008849 [Collybiopsis confluens]